MERSEIRWQNLSNRLSDWEDVDIISNQILWDIEKFQEGTIVGEEVERLRNELLEVKKEVEKDHQEKASEIRSLRKKADFIEKDLAELKMGKKRIQGS